MAADRALVIGEALLDVVERDGTVIGEHVGGSPLNVAVGLARLGRGVDFLTHLADDSHGRRIIAHLKHAGVQLVPGSLTAQRTAMAVAALDAAGSASYRFDVDWQLAGTPAVLPPLVAHTGSIAAVADPGCRATAALLETYRPSATITFDPNVRPALLTDADSARSRIERLVERCDVVKASEEDLRWVDPTRDPHQLARTWLAAGPSIVVVTVGERGATAVCAAGTVAVPAVPVPVVDTIGAGDAFMAGLIDALWSRDLLGAGRRASLAAVDPDTLGDVLRAAALCAALTVAKAGADLPDRAALQQAAHAGPY